MIFNDSKFYQQMSKSLDAVSLEIRQSVTHLKMMDDTLDEMRKQHQQALWIGERRRESHFNGIAFSGLYRRQEQSVTHRLEYIYQANAYKKLMEDKL